MAVRALPVLTEQETASFWSRVDIRGPDDCWEWIGPRGVRDYGCFHVRGDRYVASRISWSLANGSNAAAGQVCHRCDNPPCVNPDHLWLGDATANARDRELKARGANGRKTRCKHGHSLHDAYTFRGMRRCRECNRIRCASRRAKKETA